MKVYNILYSQEKVHYVFEKFKYVFSF